MVASFSHSRHPLPFDILVAPLAEERIQWARLSFEMGAMAGKVSFSRGDYPYADH